MFYRPDNRPQAIFFGSIGTLVDTTELQRRAFNAAFQGAGLGWRWDRSLFNALLKTVGGVARIESYAESRGEVVDASAIHAHKSQIFQMMLGHETMELRPGVADVLSAAARQAVPLAFVTTTSRANVDAILSSVRTEISAETFAVVIDRSMVAAPKPHPEAYQLALTKMGVESASVLAIEDTVECAQSAVDAGIKTLCHLSEYAGDPPKSPDRSLQGLHLVDRITPELCGLSPAFQFKTAV